MKRKDFLRKLIGLSAVTVIASNLTKAEDVPVEVLERKVLGCSNCLDCPEGFICYDYVCKPIYKYPHKGVNSF